MSDIYAQDLLAKIGGIPALPAGFAIGGRVIDPAMTQIPLPAAWILLGDDKPVDLEMGLVPLMQVTMISYIVMVYVPYTNQADLVNVQLPLLRTIRTAIHGTPSPTVDRWKYEGQRLVLVNTDRLAYEQKYCIRAAL